MLWAIVVVLVLLALMGGLGGPHWGWYGPGAGYGIGGVVLIVLIIWLVLLRY